MTPTYVPMNAAEKAEKVRRLEARLSDKIVLNNDGTVEKYGVVITDTPEAYLPKDREPEFVARLDKLLKESEEVTQMLKDTFGTRE